MKETDGQLIYDKWKITEEGLFDRWAKLGNENKIKEAADVQKTLRALYEVYKTDIMIAACLKYLGVTAHE